MSMFVINTLHSPRRCAILVAFALSTAATASEVHTLNQSVTTANRVAQTADETLAAVTVITREAIERSQADSLEGLLSQQLSLSVAQNGGAGQVSSVFLRGTESTHVLVLIDGIKVGSATAGTTRFEQIPLSWIDRIEIVRGSRSSLYGSEAIGGVIQIFTKQGAQKFTPSFSVGIGSHQTREWTGAVAGSFAEQGWFQAGVSQFSTAGINACRLSSACFTNEPDQDGYRNTNVNVRAGWRFENGGQADINLAHAKGYSDFDGSIQNESQTAQQLISAQLQLPLSSYWSSTWRLGQSQDLREGLLNGTSTGENNTRRNMFTWQNDFVVSPEFSLTAGVDWLNDKVSGQTYYAMTSRDNAAVFVRYRGTFAAHQIEASARQDDNEQFGKASTGGLSYGYALAPGMLFTASYSTAFKAPTFDDLYYPSQFGYSGNPQLNPEKSKNIEVGFSQNFSKGLWSFHAFDTKIRDLIVATGNTPINISEAQIRGIELASTMNVQDWLLSGNVSFLNPKDTSSGANAGKQLPRRAKQIANISVDRDFGAWRFGGDWHGESVRYEDGANTDSKKLAGFGKLDLRGEYLINPAWRVQAKIGNALDKNYETAYGYNQLGRTFALTLRYEPK